MREKAIKITPKKVDDLAALSVEECIRVEDQIMELALIFWHRKGRYHRNAWSAWQKAEREVLLRLKLNRSRQSRSRGSLINAS